MQAADGVKYALILSNRWLVMLRRHEDVKVSTTAFSKCFDITCSKPSIRQLLLWVAVQASSSQWLDPKAGPATPEDKKWLPKVMNRANATTGGADVGQPLLLLSPGDNSGDGSGSGAGAGAVSGSAGGKRPAAGSNQQPAAMRHDKGRPSSAPSSTMRRADGRGVSSQLQWWLMTLPEAPFSQLGLGQVLMRKPTRMVRHASSEATGWWAVDFRLGAASTCTWSCSAEDSEVHESLQCLTACPTVASAGEARRLGRADSNLQGVGRPGGH